MNNIWSLVWLCIVKSQYFKSSNRLSELMHYWNGKRHEPAVLTGESLLDGKSKTAAVLGSSSTNFNRHNCHLKSLCFLRPLTVFYITLIFFKADNPEQSGGSWASLWKYHFLCNQKISFFFIVPPENKINTRIITIIITLKYIHYRRNPGNMFTL